jgi:hypothetical protein
MRRGTRKLTVGFAEDATGCDARVLGELLARTAGAELLAFRLQSKRTRAPTAGPFEDELAAARLADDPGVLAVGFDASPESHMALEQAKDIATAAGATLRVIAVISTSPCPAVVVPRRALATDR